MSFSPVYVTISLIGTTWLRTAIVQYGKNDDRSLEDPGLEHPPPPSNPFISSRLLNTYCRGTKVDVVFPCLAMSSNLKTTWHLHNRNDSLSYTGSTDCMVYCMMTMNGTIYRVILMECGLEWDAMQQIKCVATSKIISTREPYPSWMHESSERKKHKHWDDELIIRMDVVLNSYTRQSPYCFLFWACDCGWARVWLARRPDALFDPRRKSRPPSHTIFYNSTVQY